MRQPLLPVAFAYVIGVTLAAWWPVSLVASIVVACAVLAAAFAVPRWRLILLWPLLIVTGVVSLTVRTAILSPHDLRLQAGESPQIATLRGTLVGDPSLREPPSSQPGEPHTLAILDVHTWIVPGKERPTFGRVLVNTRGALSRQFHSGRQVEVYGTLSPPEGATAPGLFDYRAYLRWQGIYHQVRARGTTDWRIVDPNDTHVPIATQFIEWAQATLGRGLPVEDESLRLLWAMTLGWRTALTDEVSEPFMRTGTMHIFAISGLHIALIAGILVTLLRVLQIPRAACGAVVIPLIWFYTLVTGWQASAIRSSLMMTIVVLGWSCHRPSDLLNSLAASALAILVWEPRQLFQASFQLSFFVVLSMALLLPPLERLRDRLLQTDPLLPAELLPPWRRWLEPSLRWMMLNFGISLSAWLGSLPLVAHYFHLVTPVSLLVNMLVVPLSSLALMCNLGSLLSGAWWPALAELFNHSAWFWMTATVRVCDWAAAIPCGWFHSAGPGALGFLTFYGLLIWGSGRFGQRAPWRWLSLVLIGIIGLTGVILAWRGHQDTVLTVLETGGGGVTWVNAPGQASDLLLDTGDEIQATVVTKPFLQAGGVNRLAQVAFTHGDLRHVGGWRALFDSFQVQTAGLSRIRFRSQAYRQLAARLDRHPAVRFFDRGDELAGWRVLHPDATDSFSLADDNTLVLLGTVGESRVLLLGDLGTAGQKALLEREPTLSANIIVAGVPTRGEPIGAALVAATRPQLIVLDDASPSTSASPPAYVSRWREQGITVLRTSDHGTVTIRFGKTGWKAAGMKNPPTMGPPSPTLPATEEVNPAAPGDE